MVHMVSTIFVGKDASVVVDPLPSDDWDEVKEYLAKRYPDPVPKEDEEEK